MSPADESQSKAPDFQAMDLQGHPRSLRNYRGRTVLLTFFASWCSICPSEMESLKILHRRLEPYGLEIVAVAIDDTADRAEVFAREHKIPFPVLVDHSGQAKLAYGIQGLPEAFVIGPKGNFLSITDPDTGENTVRITGPREWDSKEAYLSLQPLLSSRP